MADSTRLSPAPRRALPKGSGHAGQSQDTQPPERDSDNKHTRTPRILSAAAHPPPPCSASRGTTCNIATDRSDTDTDRNCIFPSLLLCLLNALHQTRDLRLLRPQPQTLPKCRQRFLRPAGLIINQPEQLVSLRTVRLHSDGLPRMVDR